MHAMFLAEIRAARRLAPRKAISVN